MPERIYKLQPDRTLALRGFDDLGASAALHSATADSFRVSGTFRDTADFAVLILHDADNFYEHPRIRYLPDFRFGGLTLQFDVHYSGLMPLDSLHFPTIDWPYLNAIRADGTKAQVRLSDHATLQSGVPTSAECSFAIEDNGMQPYDRLTLWYGNLAFDYIVPEVGGATASTVASALAAQINATDWDAAGVTIPLAAEATGAIVRIRSAVPGEDANVLRMYALAKNTRLRTTAETAEFSGGSGDVTLRVTLDFAALGLAEVRLLWMTFAPPLANGAEMEPVEWEARFTNWQLTGPEEIRRLSVAGPDSVRVEESDSWCQYTGSWDLEQAFYSGGYAKVAGSGVARLRVKYACSAVHDLYLGTALRNDGGTVTVAVDGGTPVTLNCLLDTDAPVNTRRRVRASVAPGEHSVEIVPYPGFRFDFLEAAVLSDVPDPLPANPRVSPALDYSTDHTYKLSPARIHWIFDRLGMTAPMNEYIGVFWWNQRKRVEGRMPQVKVRFAGAFVDGDAIFLRFGKTAGSSEGQVLQFGKSVFPADTPSTIARHFAHFLNGFSVGVWASAEDDVLTITSRSARPAYRIPFSAEVVPASGSSGSVAVTGSLENGEIGRWQVDPEQTPPLNRGARDWHADMFRQCAARGRQIAVAQSMELVNPPSGFGAVYLDGSVVETDVGFGALKSTHCNFGSGMRGYQKAVLACVAGLMTEAGLTPELQLGEFLWWFFTNSPAKPAGGMAYYDPETTAAAQARLGRILNAFRGPDDDPTVNGGADAAFLRARLNEHVADIVSHVRGLYPSAKFEVLFPYDVNHPEPAGIHQLGGRLNSFVNLPEEWRRKETASFDRLKTEALDFGAWSRDLDLARTAIELPRQLGWPRDSVRHLVPVFRPGYPWEKEVAMALAECEVVNLWAWDHVCLFGFSLQKTSGGTSSLLAA